MSRWRARPTAIDVRDVTLDGEPVLARVYVTWRAPDWTPVDLDPTTATAERNEDEAVLPSGLRLEGRFGDDAVAELEVRPLGDTLEITARVCALRDVDVNRVGLCLLHPDQAVGLPVHVRTGGRLVRTAWPQVVAPRPLATDVESLTITLPSRRQVEIDLGGDRYEIEDHRNWGDPGWKSYSPPLDRPRPRHLTAGQRLSWSIRLLPRRDVHLSRPVRPVPAAAPSAAPASLPGIGLLHPTEPVTPDLLGRLRAVAPAFLSASLDSRAAGSDVEAVWRRAVDWADSLGVPLVIEMLGGGDVASVARAVPARLPAAGVARVALFDPDTGATMEHPAVAGLSELTGATVTRGSRTNFAELNRLDLHGLPGDVTFGLCPQVHHHDDEALLATTRVIPHVVASAAALAGGGRVHVAPASLTPRHDRTAASRGGPAWPDGRWRQGLGAAWILGLLIGSAGLASIELGPATGPDGLLSSGPPGPGELLLHHLAHRPGAVWRPSDGLPWGTVGLTRVDVPEALILNPSPREATIELPAPLAATSLLWSCGTVRRERLLCLAAGSGGLLG